MTQEIIVGLPPLYDDIANAFDLHPSDEILFSWGNRIFNPTGTFIAPELIAHEAVHGERQGSGRSVRQWWRQYMETPAFRLEEEVMAHRAEYLYVRKHGNRYERRSALTITAKRLTAPLYQLALTEPNARAMLRAH